MKNILITGGAGFIGSSLADRLLLNESYQIVVVDNLLTGEDWKIPSGQRCTFSHCDVNNLGEIGPVMRSTRFDYVFHYAAVVGVKRTIENPLMVLNDLDGMRNVLNLCQETKVKRVFFSSSSEVYGEPVELPQHEETTPLNSRLPYAVVKNVGESFCRSYQQEFGLDFTIFRFFNTYGPKQSVDFVVSKFLNSALKNEPLTIYGNGLQTRTFCYVTDNTECTVRILEDSLYLNDVINIGNDAEVTIVDLAELIIRISHSKSQIRFLPPLKEGDMTRRQPDASKMKGILRRDLISLEEGIMSILSQMKVKI